MIPVFTDFENWTPDEAEQMAQTLLVEAADRIKPFDARESTDTILLASIAASTLAIAKKTKGVKPRARQAPSAG